MRRAIDLINCYIAIYLPTHSGLAETALFTVIAVY